MPLNYLPLTGAFIPFMCAVLLGHFFHPGLEPVVGPGGLVGLWISLAMGLVWSMFTYFLRVGWGAKIVFLIAVSGLVCGVLVWPVSALPA